MRVEEAREQVAHHLGARQREVVFTSSATEAVVSAIWGACERVRENEARRARVLVSAVEHSCVRDAAQRWGDVEVIRVDELGRVSLGHMRELCARPVDLVCVQSANHEVGTVQPLFDVVALAHTAGAHVLCDFTQSFGMPHWILLRSTSICLRQVFTRRAGRQALECSSLSKVSVFRRCWSAVRRNVRDVPESKMRSESLVQQHVVTPWR